MESLTIEQTQITVTAREAATGWLNAFLATSNEESRTPLYQTIAIEFFPHGVQFIGCDGTVLFRSWVATEPEEHEKADAAAKAREWPDISEVPERSIVVMDPDGFGIGFMRALLRVTGEEGHAGEPLTLTTALADDDANLALGESFSTIRLILRACGQRIDLRLYDGPYPDWRKARFGIEKAEQVPGLTLATRLFQLVGKLKSVLKVDMEFYGDKNHVAFTARGETEVRGLLMPMRRTDVEA